MRPTLFVRLAGIASLLIGGQTMAIERPQFTVLDRFGDIEIRQYAPYIVAETIVDDGYGFGSAGNEAFRRLAGYIFGNNRDDHKIAMTAPVNQSSNAEGWRVTFIMPSEYHLETLPEPLDARVELRQVPGRIVAALSYSGGWGEQKYGRHEARLLAALEQAGLEAAGEPEFARYNAPFMPPFLRRNEVLVPLAAAPAQRVDLVEASAPAR